MVQHKNFQVTATEMYEMQNSTAPDIMNDVSRRVSMPYDTRGPPVFKINSIRTIHCS